MPTTIGFALVNRCLDGTVTREVTHCDKSASTAWSNIELLTFTALVTLDAGHVTRFGAFFSGVTALVAVTALQDAFVGAVGRTMALFTMSALVQATNKITRYSPAVEALLAATTSTVGAVPAEVTFTITATALGIVACDTRLLAFVRTMALLTTIAAGIKVYAWLGAITDAMIEGITVRAFENNTCVHIVLGHLLLAIDTQVTLLCDQSV